MLLYIVLFIVGRFFYKTANDNDKNGWAHGILSIVVFFIGTNVASILIVLAFSAFADDATDLPGEFSLIFMALPFGFLACWGLYKLLFYNWSKEEKFNENIIDEIGK
ncbi:MAG: hypothetical protein AAF927_13040 [Bacteroidota bacterium]